MDQKKIKKITSNLLLNLPIKPTRAEKNRVLTNCGVYQL